MGKRYFMVLDTETLGDLCFDFGFTIIDRKGNEYTRGSYVVREIVEEPEAFNAFTDRFMGGEKIARYYFNLFMNNGKYRVVSFEFLRDVLNEVVSKYKPTICAYNAKFDSDHLDMTAQWFGYDRFFEHNVKWLDLWGIALGMFCKSRNYLRYCAERHFLTDSGNPKSSAEVVYRYLTGNDNFIEEHTALADCEIEADILLAAIARKKRLYQVDTVQPCFNDQAWQEMRDAWNALNS